MGKCTAVLLAILLVPAAARTQEKAAPVASEEREQVIAAVQQLFDAMAAHDVEGVRRVMIPEGRLFSTSGGRDASAVRSRSNQEFTDDLGKRSQKLLERIWNIEVRVHGNIATLWASFDFHLDGKFSHCGVDAFDLVKTTGGWKIAGGMYTIERTGCAPSPLGEPK